MTDMFPQGSVIRRVNIEPALLFGAGRALVLQLAHPVVAQGVEEHSEFKANFVAPLTASDAETYYREMMVVAELFGVPMAEQPPSLDAFRTYFHETVEHLEITDTGRDLTGFVVDPVLPLGLHAPLRPLLRLQRRLTIGRLPTALSQQFGFEWGRADDERFARFERRARKVFKLAPRLVRRRSRGSTDSSCCGWPAAAWALS